MISSKTLKSKNTVKLTTNQVNKNAKIPDRTLSKLEQGKGNPG